MATFISKINEHVFNLLVLTAGIFSTYLTVLGSNDRLQILAILLLKIGIYLNIGSLFVAFLNGVNYDIKKEIFEESNVAAALFVGAFWIGLAITIFTGV